MARSFTSPGGAPPKMKAGHLLPKTKKAGRNHGPNVDAPLDPLRFASSRLPNFVTRRDNTNAKSGFNTHPSQPPAGRLAKRPRKPNRGSGHEHRALL